MSQLTNIIAGLKTVLSVPVYSDNVPENQQTTAVSVINLAMATDRNFVDGSRSGRTSNWRVTVVSKDYAELESVVEELETLDNKSINGFQKVFVDHTRYEPREYSEPFRRAFVTIRAYV